jgi:hypothetical protein
MISASVAPWARFVMAITSAFLLLPFGLPAGFLARAFFAGLGFLLALRTPLGLCSLWRCLPDVLGIDCVLAH